MQQPWQNPTRSGFPAEDAAVNANRFPAVYYAKDPYDTIYEAKQQIITNGGMYGPPAPNLPAGMEGQVKQVVPITDFDVQYALGRQERDEYAQFKVWCEQQLDLGDPAQVRIFEESFPEYYEDRASLIKNLGDNMTKFAILCLLGPRTRDDYFFLWLCQTGKVPLIDGPLWKPQDWAKQGPNKKLALFNPWRAVAHENAPNWPNTLNRMNPIGMPNRALNVADRGTGRWMQGWIPSFSQVSGWRQVNTGNPYALNPPGLRTDALLAAARPYNPLSLRA